MVPEADAATFLDPIIFCLGFLLVAVGLMLSQMHRDEGGSLPAQIGLPFNLLRKLAAIAVLVGVILGFWIVGVWWLLWLPILVVLSSVGVQMSRSSESRVALTMTLIAVGLSLLFWAQGPTLREFGLFPHL